MASCSTTQIVQSSFSSPCSKPQPENDVFLNFRGEDTRNNFTDHLYRALEGKRIKTFKDDTNLEPGNPISPKLLDAIEKSRIAVVILSKNYASSRSCLEELVKILECKEEGELTVLPIFYHVDPDHVQNQRETFAVAFAEHENRFKKKKVQIWRKALSDVAELSGKTLTNGPEGKFIQEIVDLIFTILKAKCSIVYEDGFVGIDSRVEEMNSFLDMNSNDVRFIGICGKSGMGKTTLARFVFDKIRNQFEACSFLENVKEVSKARGLETLQEQLLCDISKGALRVRGVSRGIQVIKNILRGKKVLIVVDDASEKRHLEALAGKSWFGPRSRIVVTTEDEYLLKSYEIQTVYKADGLNNDEAQQLFSHKAHCEIDFLDLGNDFVTYARGSPLVLKVLGSHLCKRTKEEWETAWNQLKEILNEDILEKLRIAYNGLEELEKKLFLHIACFFKGEDQNRVAAILESICYWDDNIRKLIDKSLITIVEGKLCMHHLIQQMGWKIVYGESKDLGRRSRLWDCTDVLYVLKNNIGTYRIEGMVLNLPPNEEQEELNAEPFSKMNKLKLLKICKLHLPCLSNLSNELLLLEWHEYPLKSLPKSFQPPKLVELIMHHSGIKQLPSEFSNLLKLKLIDLSDSQNLYQTPNFNGLPNIERLIFQGCTGLHALHPSVGSLERLILLNLKDCKCLENLPHEINLKSLKILILSGCSKLKKCPKIGRDMTSMLELYLDRTAIEELPSSIKHLTSLTLLNLQDCENLSSFPSVICSLISLEIFILSGCKGQPPKARYLSGLIPTLSSIGTTLTRPYTYLTDRQPEPEPISLVLRLSFSGLSSLVSLDLSGCNLLDGALPDDLSYLSSLTSLNLRNNNFTCLPCSISQLLNLKLLFLDHCSKLQSLPYLPLSTQFVSAQGCTSLENYSNQVIVWTSGAARFTFINCHGLADDEGKIADVLLLNIHSQSLWQRYIEDQILQIKGFCLVLPQIEIPEWFKNKECGPFVRIPLPPNLFNNRSWKGIALCVIFVVPPNLIDVSLGQDSKYFHEFICHFDMDGSLLNCPLILKVPKETFVGSFGLWLYISHARFTEHFDEGSCISSLIRPKRLDIQIKMCGARILYEQDMLEFVQNSRQENFRSCDDLSRGHEKFIEDHMSSSQNYDLKLKQKLNSLLSTLYQVDWAKNHLYDYIFHQIARLPYWFTRTNLGPSIEMSLPADVHDNSTWLGFTICASYRIQMRAGFSFKLHSTIFLRYSSLSASDEVSFASYTTFPLSIDVFDESPQDSGQLVVFYIPRRGFQLKQCDHIGVSFESSDPAVQFEMCGIRLVYEQNVPEFVQTLVECMLGSPDANHQSFFVRLSDQLGMMQYCNHEKENCCPFLPERRLDPDTMRMLLPNNETIQEECTSRETFSNQVIAAGISKNSSRGSINLGIPFGNGQYGSQMSGHLECWFKPYLQGGMPRNSPDADRWLCNANIQQKGLIPSPHTPLLMMHKAEKKYEVGKVTDEVQAKQRQLKAILNKLTPQNFDKLLEQVKAVNIDNPDTLTGVISQIFDKALMEPTFCEMYANFCSHLSLELPDFSKDNEKITFKRVLLNKCQEEFERGEREQEEANKADEEGEIKQSAEEREEKRIKARRRMLGNIRLIGELYKKKMLTERIMHACIQKLLGQYDNPDEEDIEALCKLMSTIGEMIDHSKAKENMDAYFERMKMFSNNMNLSSRVRFMLKDSIDLRKNKWQQRRKVEGPKKIEEVHRDAAQERQAQTSRLGGRGSINTSTRRTPMDFGSRGSTMLSPSSVQMGGFRGLPGQVRGFGGQDVRFEDRVPYEARTLSVPLTQRPIGEDSITLGPQGGLARGMSIRGPPAISSAPPAEISPGAADPRRMAVGLNGYSMVSERTTYGPREEFIPRFIPDRFAAQAAYDQSSPQERNVNFGNRDLKNPDRSFDRSVVTSPTPRVEGAAVPQNVPSEKLPEERLKDMSVAAIKEFYSARDEKEVELCIRDMNAPGFHPSMVSLWVTDSFERKDMERDLLTKLLVNLTKSRDGVLNQAQLIKGFESVMTNLEDAVNDAPRAPEFLGRLFAKVITENVVPLSDIGQLIQQGGEEPGCLLEFGLAADVLGSTLEVIKSEKGDSVLNELRKSSNLRIEDFRPPNPNRSRKLDKFI